MWKESKNQSKNLPWAVSPFCQFLHETCWLVLWVYFLFTTQHFKVTWYASLWKNPIQIHNRMVVCSVIVVVLECWKEVPHWEFLFYFLIIFSLGFGVRVIFSCELFRFTLTLNPNHGTGLIIFHDFGWTCGLGGGFTQEAPQEAPCWLAHKTTSSFMKIKGSLRFLKYPRPNDTLILIFFLQRIITDNYHFELLKKPKLMIL